MPFKIPNSIWLQYYGEGWLEDEDGNLEKPDYDEEPEIGDVTWQDEKIFNSDIEFIRKDISTLLIAELQARIDELEHKNEVLMDSYLESETINDKGELVGSLEHFRQRIAELEKECEHWHGHYQIKSTLADAQAMQLNELESENKALRLIAGSHSMSELRRNRIMAGWKRGDTLKNEVKHE